MSVRDLLTMGDGDSMEVVFLSKLHHRWQIFPCRALQGTSALEECPLKPSSSGQTGSGQGKLN